MYLVPQTLQSPVNRTSTDQTLEKGRKHEPFEGGKVTGDRRSVARALRMDRKR